MRKRAERPLKELYDRTERISEPEITPVLQGSCRIQGPIDESDHELQRMNLGACQSEKSYMFINDSLQMRAESGTCNVCSAPCSSCMHRNMSAMVSKVECGFSDNICERKETDSCSFIGVDGLPPTNSRVCDDQQHAASETSNLLSTSSSHDSYSENAESKATLRASATYASEDVGMPPKVSLGDAARQDQPFPRKATGTSHGLNSSRHHPASDSHLGMFLHKDEEQHGVECHGDNMSCITGVRDTHIPACDHNVDLDKKDTSCSSALTYDLHAKENGMEGLVDVHHGSHYHEREVSESKSKELRTCPQESSGKKSLGGSSVNAVLSHKSDLAEFPPIKKESSSKMLSSRSHSQSAYVDHSPDPKDLEGYLTCQHQGEPSECLMNDVKLSSGGQLASVCIDRQKSVALPGYSDGQTNQIGRESSSRTLKNQDSCFENETAVDVANPSDEAIKCSNTTEQFGRNSSLLEASNVQRPDMQQQLITKGENSESDSELDDVKVCDICGDAGVEELLAVCSRCSDGAEHTYCMQIKMDKIPEGEWLCEECQLKEDAENKNVDKTDSVSGISKADDLKENSQNFGSSLSAKNLLKLDIEAIDTEVKGSDKGMQSPQKSGNMHAGTSKADDLKENGRNFGSNLNTKNLPKLDIEAIGAEVRGSGKGTSKADDLKENGQNFGSNLNTKNLPKLDIEAIGAEVRGSGKGIQSPQRSGNRHADSQEVTSVNSKRIPEIGAGSIGIASPRKNAVLSRESSFKSLDMGKVKPTNFAPSPRGQLVNSSQAISRSHTSSSSPSKVQAQHHSTRGLLSKQLSFNNSYVKPKVKNLVDSLPQKQKVMGESVSSNSRRYGAVKTMTKSASFQGVISGRSNIESVNKTQSINSPQADESRGGLKPVKEKNMIERKNSFAADRPAGTSTLKVNPKISQHNGNLSNKSEPDTLSVKKGSESAKDLGCTEVKKQTSNTAKRYESCNSEDQRPCQVVSREGARANPTSFDRSHSDTDSVLHRSMSQVRESSPREDKIKDSPHFSSSRQAALSGSRVSRCHKCNETGHATQHCPIDKLRISALKPSADRILRENSNKSKKWKNAIEAAKMRTQRRNKLSDQSECLMPSTEVSCEAASKDSQSNSSGLKGLPLEGASDGQVFLTNIDADFVRTEPVIDTQQAKHHVEASCLPKASDSNAKFTDSNAKTSSQILLDQSSLPASPFRASAIPEHEYIWQGGFEVLRTGGLPELFDGIQAHLSTGTSPKVLEAVSQFPCKLPLDEVPCLKLWPVQFQGISPKEDHIALFFFAKDIESYESTYGKLLENMLKNDLALRGNINEVELLIFPSNKLPENCQRWNMLFFLWGVFRERTDCLKVLPDLQKQPCQFKLSTDPLVQEISSPLFEASSSQKINSHESPDKESSRNNGSSNMEAVKSNIWVDFQHISSSGIEDKIYNTQGSSSIQSSSCQPAAIQPQELISSSFPRICLLDDQGQQCSSHGSCHVPDLQMGAKDLCPAFKGEATCLDKSDGHIDGKTPDHIHATSIENVNRALSSHIISSYFGQDKVRENGEKMRERERPVKHEAGIDEPQVHLMEIDHLRWEPRPNRKRAYSSSTCTFGEPSKSSVEIDWSERANFISLDDENKYKKIRSGDEIHASSSCRDENKGYSLLSSYVNEQQQYIDGFYNGAGLTGNSRSAERDFFPVDLGPVKNVVSENFIHVLSSDDEDMLEASTPDLELALGGKRKSSKKEGLSLPFPLVDRKSSEDKLPGPGVDDEDDMSASLSLSLAFPGMEKKQADKPILRTEELLPERPRVNTSLVLFGRFTDA